MAFQYRMEVFKITEMRDDCVYKTQKVNEIWLDVKPRTIEEQHTIAQSLGGDILAPTLDTRII